jgi:proline dehydrogenase
VFEKIVLSSLPYVPQGIMRRLASRYIAGETLPEALAALAELSRRGHPGILDILGENVANEQAAREAARAYGEAASAVSEARLGTYISVKPTHFGLTLDEGLCFELYAALAQRCRERGLFLRVEMEDHPTTDATLRLFAGLRARYENVGIVLQARLLRTPGDIDALPPGRAWRIWLWKAYARPAPLAWRKMRKKTLAYPRTRG